jgi:hypothetical protein
VGEFHFAVAFDDAWKEFGLCEVACGLLYHQVFFVQLNCHREMVLGFAANVVVYEKSDVR